MNRPALGFVLILSAGCAANEPKLLFEKTGSTEAQTRRDQAACVRASITGEDQVAANILKLDREAYKRCMEDRGYTLRSQS